MYDPQVDALSQANWWPGPLVKSPAFVGRVPLPSYGTPYHIQNIQLRTTALVRYEAPAYTFKSNQLYPISRPGNPNIGTKQGAAPAKGIYTGIPSGCGPNNGTGGGNPYS